VDLSSGARRYTRPGPVGSGRVGLMSKRVLNERNGLFNTEKAFDVFLR